ncbi:helix-turn-helix domain-containing protein [Barnesiella intestinihominis]|uniref:helix-turn-helix domain-containing protein n=1 Tax=Barnesiella intestinihominis TaxID=487174 RepID=UPI00266D1595|nr:helix-turn-helix domain-containing protein [Barnesiella intestinihominis]
MKEKISDLFNRALSGKTISRLNNDFVLIENPEMDGSVEFPFKSNTVISIVVRSGSMACVVDMAVHRIDMQGMFIILPSQIVEKISFSDDFDGYCLLLSSAFLANMPMTNKIPLLANIKNHGFYAMDRQAFSALENYFKMAQGVLQNPNGYKHEILTHLTIAYFYGLGSYIHETATGSSLSSRYDQITNRFLELVRENCHIHRDMGFYAGILCLSAKHVNLAVKSVTGENAMKWIERYTILNAKSMLKTSLLSVSEISDRLNFPAVSDFGKYFKKHTGYSPREFRNA